MWQFSRNPDYPSESCSQAQRCNYVWPASANKRRSIGAKFASILNHLGGKPKNPAKNGYITSPERAPENKTRTGRAGAFETPTFLTFPCRWDGKLRAPPTGSDGPLRPVSGALSEREALRSKQVVYGASLHRVFFRCFMLSYTRCCRCDAQQWRWPRAQINHVVWISGESPFIP